MFLLLSAAGAAEPLIESGSGFVSEWLFAQSAALVVTLVWIFLERRERKNLQQAKDKLSEALIDIIESGSNQRAELIARHAGELQRQQQMFSESQVKSEATHSLQQESFMRNVLDSLERAACGKSKP